MAKGAKTGGRKHGTPNKVNAATRERIEREADPIGFLCRIANGEEIECAPLKETDEEIKVRPTLDQRMTAAQTLARKITPDAKDAPIKLELPSIESARDAVKAMGVIAVAVAKGQITPAEGQALASIVETYRKTYETAELEDRIAALEENHARV